jgi:hypothetical protein
MRSREPTSCESCGLRMSLDQLSSFAVVVKHRQQLATMPEAKSKLASTVNSKQRRLQTPTKSNPGLETRRSNSKRQWQNGTRSRANSQPSPPTATKATQELQPAKAHRPWSCRAPLGATVVTGCAVDAIERAGGVVTGVRWCPIPERSLCHWGMDIALASNGWHRYAATRPQSPPDHTGTCNDRRRVWAPDQTIGSCVRH